MTIDRRSYFGKGNYKQHNNYVYFTFLHNENTLPPLVSHVLQVNLCIFIPIENCDLLAPYSLAPKRSCPLKTERTILLWRLLDSRFQAVDASATSR